jgi:N-acetylglucosaminyldiphosphoundecaprenol N-acetyl-beta-D-mannosaminyltransferase
MLERKKAFISGFGVDLFDFSAALEYVMDFLRENKGMQIITINPEMIETAKKNEDFAKILNSADLAIPDGIGIKLALKIKGINQENIPGIEFSKKIIELCAENSYAIALLGAKEEILQKAKDKLLEEFPSLNIAYARNGYFSQSEEKDIINEIKSPEPKAVFVALGAPKQELLINALKKDMQQTVFIGVGGSFDVWSGVTKRAPDIYRKLGLEWLYRAVKEPSRLKRIFPALPMFLIGVIMESVFKKEIVKDNNG